MDCNIDINVLDKKSHPTAFIVSLPDNKSIVWAGSCDLNNYSSANFIIQV